MKGIETLRQPQPTPWQLPTFSIKMSHVAHILLEQVLTESEESCLFHILSQASKKFSVLHGGPRRFNGGITEGLFCWSSSSKGCWCKVATLTVHSTSSILWSPHAKPRLIHL